MPMNRKEYRANGGTTEPETQIDPSTAFSTFDKDQLANIHRHYWKERLKISKLAKDESNMLKASEDIALQKLRHFTAVRMVGAQTCLPPYKRL